MSTFINNSIVVDSSFISRKQVIKDLVNNSLVSDVLEASSVRHAIDCLKKINFEACFIGPSLSENIAVDLIKTGKKRTSYSACCFIAIVRNNSPSPNKLIEAGAHGIIKKPYTRESFTNIVKKAVTTAKLTNPKTHIEASGWIIPKGKEESLPLLSDTLTKGADQLKQLAETVTAGVLRLDKSGSPDIHTQEVIYTSILKLLSDFKDRTLPSNYDKYFANAVLEWFIERIHTSRDKANKHLKEKLINYRSSS